jgi:hypothetical protein
VKSPSANGDQQQHAKGHTLPSASAGEMFDQVIDVQHRVWRQVRDAHAQWLQRELYLVYTDINAIGVSGSGKADQARFKPASTQAVVMHRVALSTRCLNITAATAISTALRSVTIGTCRPLRLSGLRASHKRYHHSYLRGQQRAGGHFSYTKLNQLRCLPMHQLKHGDYGFCQNCSCHPVLMARLLAARLVGPM